MKNGWTLPEMMITLAIAGIVSAEAIPSFRRMAERDSLVASTNLISAAISDARYAAVSKDVPVTFCPGNRASGCISDWSDGRWIVFVDPGHDGALDPGDTLLMSGRIPDTEVSIDGNGPFRMAVVFVPTGMPERVSGAFAAGRLRLCLTEDLQPNATDIVMAATGRVRTEHHDFEGDCPPL